MIANILFFAAFGAVVYFIYKKYQSFGCDECPKDKPKRKRTGSGGGASRAPKAK